LEQFKLIFQLAILNKCTNRGENLKHRSSRQIYPFFNNYPFLITLLRHFIELAYYLADLGHIFEQNGPNFSN